MKNFTLLIFLFAFQLSFSQNKKVCLSAQEDGLEDVNQISVKNKCKVSGFKKHLSVKRARKSRVTKKSYTKKSILSDKNSTSNTKNVTKIKEELASLASSIVASDKSISFTEVDQVPLFKSKQRNTDAFDDFDDFNEKIIRHIDDNLKDVDGAEGIVAVSFIIDINGDVNAIKASCDDNSVILEQEAIRIISLLRRFTPGKHHEKKVNVFYNFQMEF
ncbi:energy transducer TonB [Tenacibaculum finnmarkense]|uniref:energy transducer TonB n=1 Tax=Tenacibaculum finnmarkense TaxID=2781243 RepID=UPI001E3F48E6|nr:energy transducer TonB [Tenacibaculum finnmarkense]MCD8423075.1 energy transducer TonB [Tenacibaculum finnmarkense genomovar ulcerans]MCG8239291.1 energy transducer TonB [Tenacibaculum finnmarkense genomovar ulcerans]